MHLEGWVVLLVPWEAVVVGELEEQSGKRSTMRLMEELVELGELEGG